MKVNEIFESIQGESSWAGLPCIFVRLFGCNLNCSYCDTKYATSGNDFKEITPEYVGEKIISFKNSIIEFTGGEPLLQTESIIEVMKYLREKDSERNYHFLLETNGAIDIQKFLDLARKEKLRNYYFIMDMKMPSSGQFDKMILENLNLISETDEVKFVCGTKEDYETAKKIINDLNLSNALISPVFEKIKPKQLVEWILQDKLRARFQIQLHKIIWEPNRRGV